MSKQTNTISVYLLKTGYNQSNALKKGLSLVPSEDCSIPDGASLYLCSPPSKEPWWKSYLGIKRPLSQSMNSAILFLTENSRCYAVVFGNVAHYLDPNSYEYDFGIITTLNATDAKKLKSADSVEPETARRNRIQVPNAAELTSLDLTGNDKVFKKLSGSIKDEFKTWFSNLTGSDNARVSTKKSAKELGTVCSQLHQLYLSTEYKTTFSNFRNICRVLNPSDIATLNNKLIAAIKSRDSTLILSVPDNLKYDEFRGVRFGRGKTYPLLLIDSFWDHEGDRLSDLTWKSFRNRRVRLVDDDDGILKEYAMNRCVIWETELDSASYHFVDGIWYFVEKKYLTHLANELSGLFVPSTLPENNCPVEAKYNESVASENPDFVCLDRSNFSSDGANIEPCDLYTVKDSLPVFIHVKIGVISSRLSHLFQQGLNSLDYLRGVNPSAKEKLCSILRGKMESSVQADAYTNALDSGSAKIIYAILCKKDPMLGSKALPLFSRITLARVAKELKRAGVAVEVQLVKDNYDKSSCPQKRRRGHK